MRVTDTNINTFNSRSAQNMQQSITAKQREASTGKAAHTYSEIPNKAPLVLGLQREAQALHQEKDNLELMDSRAELIETALSQIIDRSGDFRAKLLGLLNSGSYQTDFAVYAQNTLQDLERYLNQQNPEGLYIFGGIDSTTKPVDIEAAAWPTPAVGDPPHYGYTAISGMRMVGLKDGEGFSYGITAHEEGFASFLHALKICTTTNTLNPSEEDKIKLREAVDHIEKASLQLPDLLTGLGHERKVFETSQDICTTQQNFIEEKISDVLSADRFSALIESHKESANFSLMMTAVREQARAVKDYARLLD